MPKTQKRPPAAVRAAMYEQVATTAYLTLWGEAAHIPASALPPMPRVRVVVEPTEAEKEAARGRYVAKANPLLAAYGSGPVGVTCGKCAHCRYPEGYVKRHWKCDLRKLTHGSATDHSVRFQACGRFTLRKAGDDGAGARPEGEKTS